MQEMPPGWVGGRGVGAPLPHHFLDSAELSLRLQKLPRGSEITVGNKDQEEKEETQNWRTYLSPALLGVFQAAQQVIF